jgi:hypothetical protein
MQKTSNEIKSSFELLASGHYQIHSFLYAQEFEQQAYENLIYPLMLVYPLGGNLSGTTYTRNYRVVIADRVLKSEGNELEVESDTQLIALDVLAYWMKLGTNERFSITSSNTITPFWEKWGDEVTGHFVDIGIEEFYDFNSCAIPLSSAIPSPTNPCKDARILINSVIYGNAPSDTNFNVVVKDQLGALVGSLIGGEWIVNTGGSCADASYTIEDSLGNILYTGTIPSGGSATEVIDNSTLNVNKSDGTLISSRSILAQGTDSYNVGDSSAVLKDEDGNVLSTTGIKATESEDIVAPNGDVSVNSVAFDDVLSGGTLDIEVLKSTGNDQIGSKQGQYWRIGDSTAVIKDSANNTLKSEAIMATETENIVVNDSVAVIKNSVGTTLKSENILAQASENITINDSSVENSDASYSVNVLAEGSLTLPDSQININGVDSGDVISVKTIDVNLEDSLGDPVTPTSVGLVGNTLTIEVPSGGGSYDLDLVDRFGNAFPTKQVTANATWDLRTLTPFDWADLFLSRETAWGVSGFYTDTDAENAVIDLVDDLFSAGLWELMDGVYPLVGGTAAKHKWNLRYPFANENSMQLLYAGSPTHNREGISVTNSSVYACRITANPSYLNLNASGHWGFYYRAYTGVNGLHDLRALGDSRQVWWHLNDPNAGSGTLRMAWCGAVSQVNPSPALTLTGQWTLNRPNSSNLRQIRNGVLDRTFTNAASDVLFDTLSPYGFFQFMQGTKTVSSITFGKGLTPTQEADLYTAIQTFQTTLGRQL